MSTEIPLQLNDPVSIESPTPSSSGQQLHGIVAYLGPVEFSEQAQDFVGVRLTGASVGLGEHDGVVNGKRYFEAGPNGGIFIRYSSRKITKRVLSRLQELQLKRELGASSNNTATVTGRHNVPSVLAASEDTVRQKPTSPTPFGTKITSPSVDKPTIDKGASATTGTKSRLDEIRKKREAAMMASTTVRSGKSSEDDASTTSSVSNSSSFTSPKGGVAPSSKNNTSAKDNLNAASRLKELRLKRDSSNLSRSSGRTTPLKDSPSVSSLLITPQQKKDTASSETQVEYLKNALHGKEAEILRLKSALEETKQMCEQKACELERALESLRIFQEQKQQTSVEFSSVAVDDSNSCMEDQQSQRQDNADKKDLQRQLSEALANIQTLQQEALEGKAKHVAEISALNQELAAAKSHTLAAERESQIVKEQFERKSSNAADYLKERAKLTAEISTLHRRVSDLQAAASEYETSLEGLVLDKEALLEEKEELLDQLEEKSLEIATLQIELEEVKVELEEGKAAFEKCNKGHSMMTLAEPSVKVVDENAVEESSKALSSQNSRLREALMRLREQTNIEKLELTKQLRLAEKDAAAGRGLIEELESLRNLKVKNASEIRDLKEIVDTQNVYEQMVENLSNKVTQLEDENIELRNAIRDLEEAGEISQEMEEVQAELNKSLRLDIEKRDALIRNFEEAIKIQRRREEELNRAIGKYRSVIECLEDEKTALLAAHRGGEGEKSHLVQTSQRALAQASQLASDQAALRKRDADAAFNRINAQIACQHYTRIGALLPKENFIAEELACINGEVLMSKIAAYASASLSALEDSFRKIIAASNKVLSSQGATSLSDNFSTTDLSSHDVSQQVHTMIYQGKCSKAIIEASANCVYWLCVGQWPQLLTPDESKIVGSAALSAGFSSNMEHLLCKQLRTLHEEGYLSPFHGLSSSLTDLEESIDNMKALYREIGINLPPTWQNRTSWVIIKETTAAKYLFLAIMAALSSILSSIGKSTNDEPLDAAIAGLFDVRNNVDQVLNEIERTACRLVHLPFDAESPKLTSIAETCQVCSEEANTMLLSLDQILSKDLVACDALNDVRASAGRALNRLASLSSSVNVLYFAETRSAKCHPLSPEAECQWESLLQVLGHSGNGIRKDCEILMTSQIRASGVENRISNAILSEQKLLASENKVVFLEKTLAKRSQVLAMQAARMAELEKLLFDEHQRSRTNEGLSTPKPEAELEKLRDENRVLSEAVDVLHAQVDEYESEIRVLKEQGGKMQSRRALWSPNKITFGEPDLDSNLVSASRQGSGDSRPRALLPLVSTTSNISLEAAVFRPAIKMLCAEIALWKEKAFKNKLALLPQLLLPYYTSSSLLQPQDGEKPQNMNNSILADCREELILASAQIRIALATVSITDISRHKDTLPHGQVLSSRKLLREQWRRNKLFAQRLKRAGFAAQSCLSKFSGTLDFGRVWPLPM